MAGYKAGEARILALVQGLTNFDANNATIGDWTVLNLGKSERYAVLKPGVFDNEYITMITYRAFWETLIEVWQLWKIELSDTANLQLLEDRVQEIIDGLQIYRKTNDSGGTVLHAEISRGDFVTEVLNQDGGMEWIMQEVSFEWSEEIAPSFAE